MVLGLTLLLSGVVLGELLPSKMLLLVVLLLQLRRRLWLLLLFNTTRTTSGPPSTRASIAMDGGVADTTCYYTGR
jgi:hypothetical protein